MRVFYVRPSDNGNYGVREALETLQPPPERVDLALFRGLRVPLEPLNYDPDERGLANLNDYDCVILAGVDPVVLTPRDHLALLAFVERGGGLMLLGGTHSFSNAEGTYLPISALLPVDILRGLAVEANAVPVAEDHPIARALPHPLGYVGKVHPLVARPGAAVAMRVGDLPLVVAGEHGYGRVVVVASYPECQQAEYGWFFTGDAFDDFLRNALAWMAKEHHSVWIDEFHLPNRQVTAGGENYGKALVNAAEPSDVQLTTRLTREGRTVHESTARLHVEEAHEALFSFDVPDGPGAGGLYYVAVVLSGPDGRPAARRDVAIEVVNPIRASVEFEYGRRHALPGETVRLRIGGATERPIPPREVSIDVTVLDPDGREVHRSGSRTLTWQGGAYGTAEIALALPRLRPGTYRVRAELSSDKGTLDIQQEPLHIVARPSTDERFPMASEGGCHLDRASTEEAVARLAAAGVDALSLPGPVVTPWGDRDHRETMVGHAEETAVRAGLLVAHHRRSLVPGFAPAAPLDPCPLSSDFQRALGERTRPILEAAASVRCLLFHELAPSSAVQREQHCRCPECQAAYKRTLGGPMPEGDPAELTPKARHAFRAFLSSYWWHVYSTIRKLRDEVSPATRLSLASGAAAFLSDGPAAACCDLLSWARACDVVEVACEADAATTRLSLDGHRPVCVALGKPFGALVGLGSPAFPAAEAVATALASGAACLRVAENPRFVFGKPQGTVAAELGPCLQSIGRAGPLLTRTKRPTARLALLFPSTQMAGQGTAGLLAAHRLLADAFGEVDVLHQRLATPQRLAAYGAVALFGSRVLPKKVAAALLGYVEQGGLLLADDAAMSDPAARPLPWPRELFGSSEEAVFGAATVCTQFWPAGRTALFSQGFARAYQSATTRGDPFAARALRQAVARVLAEHGVRPRARSDNPAIEAALRLGPGLRLVVAVNHGDAAQQARVELDPEAAAATYAIALATGQELPVEGGDPLVLAIELEGRTGGIWALYAERPSELLIEAPLSSVACGGELPLRVLVGDETGAAVPSSHILRVLVSDPNGQERGDLGGDRVAVEGILETLMPMAVNDPPGTWRLCVTEPVSGRVARTTFEVAAEEAAEAPSPSSQSPGSQEP